jgi:hypothetical protein
MMDYSVVFRETLEMTEAEVRTIYYYNEQGPYTLDEVRALCQAMGCHADLFNEAGWRKGWVHPDGTFTLV